MDNVRKTVEQKNSLQNMKQLVGLWRCSPEEKNKQKYEKKDMEHMWKNT